MNSALRTLLITVAVIVVVGLGVFFYARHVAAPTITPASQTATSTGVGITYTGSSTPTVTEVGTVSVPNYKKPLTFYIDTPADAQAALNSQLVSIQATLAKSPTDFDSWVNLGVIYKIAGDYQGAATVWTYVTKLYPSSSVGWEDLGGIYLDFIKNYPKAEADFKQAIAVNPTDDTAYESLVALYTTYGYGSPAEAKALVAQGLKANSKDAELLQLQSQLNASASTQ